jgi:FkbM family methyltransferase
VKYSNSYFFEQQIGWRCVAVDPLPTYAAMWSQLRERSCFHQVALGSVQGTARLLMPHDASVREGESHSADMFSTLLQASGKVDLAKFQEVEVPVVTAASLLDQASISAVGILSIDVEGFEIEVLKGYDFKRHPTDIVLVENNATGRMGNDEIRDYLIRQGFTYHARFWRMDDVFVSARLGAGL